MAINSDTGTGQQMEQDTDVVAHDAIAKRAYEIWEASGRPEGMERKHWTQAERELNRGNGSSASSSSGNASSAHDSAGGGSSAPNKTLTERGANSELSGESTTPSASDPRQQRRGSKRR